jgi:uncharacterized protein YjdB
MPPISPIARLLSGIAIILAGVACEELRTTTEPLPIGSSLLITPVADTIYVADSIDSDDTVRFTAAVLTFSRDTVEFTDVEWMSSNPQVATVDSTGLVTAHSLGEAIITVVAGEEASGIIVVAPATASLELTPAIDTLLLGDSLQLFAQAYDAGGAPVQGVRYVFSTNNSGVATVDSTGMVRTVAPGDARITVNAAGRQAFSDITVEDTVSLPPLPPPPPSIP